MTSTRDLWKDSGAFVASFHLGADLQQRGGLLHDAYEQRVDVILQISDQKFHLLYLRLALLQKSPSLLVLLPLLPELGVSLDQQIDQLAVVQVIVQAPSLY